MLSIIILPCPHQQQSAAFSLQVSLSHLERWQISKMKTGFNFPFIYLKAFDEGPRAPSYFIQSVRLWRHEKNVRKAPLQSSSGSNLATLTDDAGIETFSFFIFSFPPPRVSSRSRRQTPQRESSTCDLFAISPSGITKTAGNKTQPSRLMVRIGARRIIAAFLQLHKTSEMKSLTGIKHALSYGGGVDRRTNIHSLPHDSAACC